MSDTWTWASLDDKQMGLLKETEETLGADIVLAFQPGDGGAQASLKPAELNDSQQECLQGAEEKMNSILVAYSN